MSVSSQEKDRAKAPDDSQQESALVETLRVIVHAVIIAVVIRTFVLQPFYIPSESMESTLLVGDYLFVSKFSYGFSHFSLPWSPHLFSGRILASQPQRGDVVVFRLPREDDVDYIKRVIGLPGDSIQMKDGVLNINGVPVKREQLPDYKDEDTGGAVKRWRETLPNGVSYTTLDLYENGQLDSTPIYKVPPGRYFMMGDNRDNSSDSRVPQTEHEGVGFVPFENLIGRAQIVFFSVGHREPAWHFWTWPWTLRWSRLFTIVR
ncbi:MAG TPA: signal peptidase I [Xanthobacteraceae bacterium]|jgi:signal peptidase I